MPSGLSMEHVCHQFDQTPVLRDVGFDVAPGELVCLLGPSGCGKTTALRIAAGLERLQAGRVSIHGEEVASPGQYLEPEKRGVGLVFQDYALFPHLDVARNVGFGLKHYDDARRKQAVNDSLQRVGMAEFAKAFPHQLSGGQQQRIALARALAPTPRVMLLDEPFSGLDVARRAELRDTTLHVLKNAGIATVMVTHDPEEAMYMADRIIVMDAGQVMQDGTPEDLYLRPANHFVASFFGETNRFSSVVNQGRASTPLGEVAASGIGEGRAVDVLVRPEGLLIGEPSGTGDILAKIDAVRALGGVSLMHLSLEGGPHIHARVPRRHFPSSSQTVSITLDPDMTFVFPRG